MGKYSVLLIGAVVLIALILLVNIYRRSQAMSLSGLKNALAGIGRKHFLLIPLALLFGCAIFCLDFSEKQSYSSAVVALNFAEASNGQDFDGTRYNMSEIIGKDVIERAIADAGFENVTAEQLSECLSVSPLVQGDAYNEHDYHIATEFLIEYQASKETKHLDAANVPQMVAQAYKSLYIERFTSIFDVLVLDEEVSFEGMEYLDAVKYLDKECSKLKFYMNALDDENSSFRDSSGNTFSGLAQKIDLLKDVQIEENLTAFIIQNKVAKDAAAYIGRLEYDNVLLDYEKQKAAASFAICNEAIAKYDKAMSRIVLVPTWDGDGEFYMGRTKIGPDALSMKAYDYSMDVANAQKNMENNSNIIGAMRTGSERHAASVQAMIEQIYQTMLKYADEAWNLAREYSDTQMNQCISISAQKLSVKKLAVYGAGAAVIFYGMLVLAVIAGKSREALNKSRASRQAA